MRRSRYHNRAQLILQLERQIPHPPVGKNTKGLVETLQVAEVRKASLLTPNMTRITVGSSALIDFPVRRSAQWVRIFVPTPETEKPSGRAYTIRYFREPLGEMDIDFLHYDGPCSTWAVNAKASDIVQIAGQRSGFQLDPKTCHLIG